MNTDTQSPRFTAERQRRIEQMLREQGRVEVLELARLLQVSEHTVRRDLLALQGQGLLQRTHGGAVTLDTQRLGLGDRAAVLADAKAAVGRAAAALVEPGQTVVLDAGSTPLAMARALTVRPLTVITSSLDVAAHLRRRPAGADRADRRHLAAREPRAVGPGRGRDAGATAAPTGPCRAPARSTRSWASARRTRPTPRSSAR